MTDEYTKLKRKALFSRYHQIQALYEKHKDTPAGEYLYKERDKAVEEIIAFFEKDTETKKAERLKKAN